MSKHRDFGSIRKLPSGQWQVRFRHPISNRLISAGRTFDAKADAAAYLAAVRTDQLRGQWIPPTAGQVTLRSYANQWLQSRRDLGARTNELYRYLLDRYILPELGSTKVARLEPSQIRAWYTSVARDHRSTATKAYRLLASILRTAVTDRMILVTPCRVEGAGVERSAERPVATVAEVTALADAMPERLRLLVLLACWCQLRRGELLGLRRQDIDLLHATLTVSQTRIFTMKGLSLTKGPKTEAGRRTLAIPSHMVEAVGIHLDRFVGSEPDALVLTGEQGGPLTTAVLHKAWSRARNHVGRPDLRIHDLRHTGLTLAAAAGATVAELMHRAGHSSAAAALRYQHATADRDRVLADALAKLGTPDPVLPFASAAGRPKSD